MANESNFEPAKEAITNLVKIPSSTNQARETIIAAPRGPFKVNITAGYDRSLFVNRKTCEYEFDVDFPDARQSLNKFLMGAGGNLDKFLQEFKSVDDLMKKTVPTVRERFEAAFAELVTITSMASAMQAMGSGLSMNFAQQVTFLAQLGAGQLGVLIDKLEQLGEHLQTGRNQVDTGTGAVDAFREKYVGFQPQLARVKECLRQAIPDNLKAVQEIIDKQPAGHEEAKHQFQFFQTYFESTLEKVGATFSSDVAGNVRTATDSLNVMHDTVDELIVKNEKLMDELKGKRGAPSSEALIQAETLNLGAATEAWRDLAEHTLKELDQNS